MRKGEKSCYICGKIHDFELKQFPKNFPNKWKWCCRCLNIAEFIIEKGIEYTINFIFDFNTEVNDLLRRVSKLNRLITIE